MMYFSDSLTGHSCHHQLTSALSLTKTNNVRVEMLHPVQ